MRLPMTGGCQCGAVRYEIDAPPMALYACHCTDCQRQTGAGFALSMIVPRAALRVIEGAPSEWLRPGAATASGTPTLCIFCGRCGNRLYHLPSRNLAVAVLKPGTLDDTSWLRPVGHIWTERAQPWVTISDGAPAYPRQPPDYAALEAAWRRQMASQP